MDKDFDNLKKYWIKFKPSKYDKDQRTSMAPILLTIFFTFAYKFILFFLITLFFSLLEYYSTWLVGQSLKAFKKRSFDLDIDFGEKMWICLKLIFSFSLSGPILKIVHS